ncbi:MAG TPA: DUF5693 family protein [bacterium]|nr:DUF5693 family protein [bacterium]
MSGRRRRPLLLAIGLGVLAALAVLWMRWGVESRYRTVEIVLDGPDWEALAVREGRDPLEILTEATRRGATSIALYERTLERMAEQGEVSYLSADEARAALRAGTLSPAFAGIVAPGEPIRPGSVYVAGPPDMLAFLEATISGILGSARVRGVRGVLEIRGLREDLEQMGLGFRPEDLERYRAAGLAPVLRFRNYPGLTAAGLAAKGEAFRALGEGIPIVFELTEVLGYERLLPDTAAMLRAAGARYGRIEVFNVRRRQRGEERLAREMHREVIRLFSLTPDELLVLSPADARDKFVRSARERNIRLLYIRPFIPTAGVVGTASNLTLVEQLARDLRRFGLRTGRAVPLPEVEPPLALRGLTAVGALATMALAFAMLAEAVGAPVPARLLWVLIGLGVLITVALLALGPLVLWLKLLALGTAAGFPGAAIAMAVPRRSGTAPVLAGVRTLWLASLGSVAAGLLVAALLTRWEFMMAADVFLGVKIAQLLPVLLVVLLLWRYDRPVRSWRETATELWEWSGHPLLMRYAIAVVVVGLAGVILLARSGNFGLPLLGVEERLRNLMEDLLVARPRTKEYLIGHPALVLAGAAAAAGWHRWVMPLAAAGAIGQAGIVNSFSHLHTPLLYTAWRTVNALWLGTLLGGATALVLPWIASRFAPSPPVPPRR